MNKVDGAFLTIGELARELGVAQHILRYWETRFPQLRPLQRAGNRRYYRPQDVEVARRIDRLLNVEGFTVKGAAKALDAGPIDAPNGPDGRGGREARSAPPVPSSPLAVPTPTAGASLSTDILRRLQAVRRDLAEALGAE